jgi:hypothetical protein
MRPVALMARRAHSGNTSARGVPVLAARGRHHPNPTTVGDVWMILF